MFLEIELKFVPENDQPIPLAHCECGNVQCRVMELTTVVLLGLN